MERHSRAANYSSDDDVESWEEDDLLGEGPPRYTSAPTISVSSQRRDNERAPDISPPAPRPATPVLVRETSSTTQRRGKFPAVSKKASRDPGASRTHPQGGGRYVLAIDYGTTFTGFAYSQTTGDVAKLQNIHVLQEWTSKMNELQVPSVISYSQAPRGVAQWGSDFTDDAITISRTKLELEPQSILEELDMLVQVIKGTGCLKFRPIQQAGNDPAYTSNGPEEIIADYLKKIFDCASRELSLAELKTTNTPVDVVLTVPVGWSTDAYRSMFKALRAAGFNRKRLPTLQDTIMVTEAEAASYFTVRDMARQGVEFLMEGDCFILCDAGGGTVDLVSFQVSQTSPHLILRKATEQTGGRFGSSLIDHNFKEWLRNIIGRQKYKELDQENAYANRISPHTIETGRMRMLMREFNAAKAAFTGSEKSDIKLDLARSLGNFSVEGRIEEGQLSIRRREMQKLMDPCVNGVIRLIKDQISKVVEAEGRRVRDIILVGGFGASPYLRTVLQNRTPTIREQGIGIRRPDGSNALTAIAQGAVIYGIEKGVHKENANYMFTITRSYGILRKDRIGKERKEVFEWMIRKGDLALSNKDTTILSDEFYVDREEQLRKMQVFGCFPRPGDDDNVPMLWENGRHDVEPLGSVNCDFSTLSHRLAHPGSLIPGRTDIGPLKWRWTLKAKANKIDVAVLYKGTKIGNAAVRLDIDRLRD